MSDEVELLDVKAVAKLLSCSPRTVWRLRDRGAIPAPIILSSGVVRWRRTVLSRWLDELQPSGRAPRRSMEGRTDE
jgi:predicted DNA-binding transcriptional regulator AlpA